MVFAWHINCSFAWHGSVLWRRLGMPNRMTLGSAPLNTSLYRAQRSQPNGSSLCSVEMLCSEKGTASHRRPMKWQLDVELVLLRHATTALCFCFGSHFDILIILPLQDIAEWIDKTQRSTKRSQCFARSRRASSLVILPI